MTDSSQNSTSSNVIFAKKKLQNSNIKFRVSIKLKRRENFIEYDYSTHQLVYLEDSRVTLIPSVFMRDLYFGEHEGKKLLVHGRLSNFDMANFPNFTKVQNLYTQPLVAHLVKVFF